TGLVQKLQGQSIGVIALEDDSFHTGVNQHFNAQDTGLMSAVQSGPGGAHPVQGRLDDGVLLRVSAPAHLMPFARGYVQLFPQAAHVQAVGHAPGSPIVTCGDNMFVPHQHSTYLPAQAGGPAGNQDSYVHEILIPRGPAHLPPPPPPAYFVPKRRSPASPSPGTM